MWDPQGLTTGQMGDWKRLHLLSPWSCCSLPSQSLKSKTPILLEPAHLVCVCLQESWTECQETEPVAAEKQQGWGGVTVTLRDVTVF